MNIPNGGARQFPRGTIEVHACRLFKTKKVCATASVVDKYIAEIGGTPNSAGLTETAVGDYAKANKAFTDVFTGYYDPRADRTSIGPKSGTCKQARAPAPAAPAAPAGTARPAREATATRHLPRVRSTSSTRRKATTTACSPLPSTSRSTSRRPRRSSTRSRSRVTATRAPRAPWTSLSSVPRTPPPSATNLSKR